MNRFILALARSRKPKILAHKLMVFGAHYNLFPGPTRIEGQGSIRRLPALLRSKGIAKPLIVTDKGLVAIGLVDRLTSAMEESGIPYAVFDGVEPDPGVEVIEDGYSAYLKDGCDSVIGFGGGSSMDAAKVIAARVVRPRRHASRMGALLCVSLPFPKRLPRIITVPTTAGTGAEETYAAVISDHENNTKYLVKDPIIRPHIVVLDPELTVGLPPYLTAVTAIDALAHVVEAYLGDARCRRGDRYARKAIKAIFDYIDTAYRDGTDIHARAKLLEAANQAGRCLNLTFLTYVHPFAHKIGALYGLVHGAVLGAAMPLIFEFYRPEADARLAELAELVGIRSAGMSTSDKASAFIQAIIDLNERYEIPTTIPEIRDEDFREIADAVHYEAFLYPVPKLMTDADIFEILREIQGKKHPGGS